MPSKQLSPDPAFETAEVPEIEPVRKSIRVQASPERAFRVFTQEMDSWWPRTHHIGNSPLKRVVVEGHTSGAIYSEQEDGTICPWGSVLAWEPPHRFVMAWHITPEWQYEPDLKKCSEVELRFTPADDGSALVELEHRELHRHGAGGLNMRNQVDSQGGWGAILTLFGAKTEEAK